VPTGPAPRTQGREGSSRAWTNPWVLVGRREHEGGTISASACSGVRWYTAPICSGTDARSADCGCGSGTVSVWIFTGGYIVAAHVGHCAVEGFTVPVESTSQPAARRGTMEPWGKDRLRQVCGFVTAGHSSEFPSPDHVRRVTAEGAASLDYGCSPALPSVLLTTIIVAFLANQHEFQTRFTALRRDVGEVLI